MYYFNILSLKGIGLLLQIIQSNSQIYKQKRNYLIMYERIQI